MRGSSKVVMGMGAVALGGFALLQRVLGPGLMLLQSTSEGPSDKGRKKAKLGKGKKGKDRK